MNYLAHILVSTDNDDIKIGNFIGDYIKGRIDQTDLSRYPSQMILGMRLHREIDSFTDTHPIVHASIARLQPRYHKFSGIVVDMFYDHLLAKHFDQFSETPLPLFSEQFYTLITHRKSDIPVPMEGMVRSMIKRDWLNNYIHIEGIDWALKGIAQRSKFASGIENAAEDLQRDFALYEGEFLEFFPLLQQHCINWLHSSNAKL